MLNHTEYNDVVICVLPKGVELPTSKNFDAYCKKYAPKHIRKMSSLVPSIIWEADGGEIVGENGRHYFLIERIKDGYRMLVEEYFPDGTHVGSFEVNHIPSTKDAMQWAERYSQSWVALWCDCVGDDIMEYEWVEVCDMAKVEADALAEM